jgi:hypothetical protein
MRIFCKLHTDEDILQGSKKTDQSVSLLENEYSAGENVKESIRSSCRRERQRKETRNIEI